MHSSLRRAAFLFLTTIACSVVVVPAVAQPNSGSIQGTITDPTGAVVPGATITLQNPVSEAQQTATSNTSGEFQFKNLSFNLYHLMAVAPGFSSVAQDAQVRSSVPVAITLVLAPAGSSTTITVDAGDLLENDNSLHTDIDRQSFAKLPVESKSSTVSSLVTLMTPGVTADSNGMFHGLGDHAENSFSVDGQPITDQQSKTFSNQIPSNSIQSMQVIDGAPPAEYGDKTSLVVVVTTRSGLGVKKPTGSITTSYGSFGASTVGLDLSAGSQKWGNFISADGLNSGRFLDAPEFSVFHDKGNEENIFDRVDYQGTNGDSVHLNLNYTRSWFQTPNTYDNLDVKNVVNGGTGSNPVFDIVGNADQRSQINTFNIAPTYTRLLNQYSVLNLGAYARKDAFYYFPSNNPLADLGPPNLQRESISQQRTLLNAGVHSDISYVRGIHNVKAGVTYDQTILRESDGLGAVDSTLNAPCLDAGGNPLPGFTNPAQCAAFGYQPNPAFLPVLLPYDLTRGGHPYQFLGRTDVKELALYIEDQIKTGNWLFNLGMRGDIYNGLTMATQAEPRLGLTYTIHRTNTVLRSSYARTLETPFNENLVLSSRGCADPVLNPLLSCTPGVLGTLQPGFRNEFHAGLQQAAGKYLVFSGDYLWKYTHNAFDFSVLGNTPITFPIDWHNSKISGFALRTDVPTTHGISAFIVMSSVAARFFPPQVAGAGATVGQNGQPFRIDHDERFNQTTHLQYQPWKSGPWLGFNWRYDSGMVAGQVPFAVDTTTPVDLTVLTADQQQQAGLACGNQRATLTSPLGSCAPSLYRSTLISLPAPGTENDDKNPPRIAPRNLFDLAVGDDNLFRRHSSKTQWSAQLTVINLTDKYALYNFLSTFSGTHYVSPRAITGQVGFHF